LWWVALERSWPHRAHRDEIGGEERFFYCERTARNTRFTRSSIGGCARSATRRDAAHRRDLCRRYGVDPDLPCREFCMTWPEIAEMAKSPLATIGAHTINPRDAGEMACR